MITAILFAIVVVTWGIWFYAGVWHGKSLERQKWVEAAMLGTEIICQDGVYTVKYIEADEKSARLLNSYREG